ncbi:MAG: DUF896 domain-containing protein [Ruminococcus sp.]|nr:DUF896 domain-containing protein [Ruminococcus sp.]
MEMQELLSEINALAKKKREEGLTEAEKDLTHPPQGRCWRSACQSVCPDVFRGQYNL